MNESFGNNKSKDFKLSGQRIFNQQEDVTYLNESPPTLIDIDNVEESNKFDNKESMNKLDSDHSSVGDVYKINEDECSSDSSLDENEKDKLEKLLKI